MTYRVQYLSDRDDPVTECWSFMPLLPGIEGAKTLAREGLADVRDHFGATGFLICDSAGAVIAEEFIAPSARLVHIVR